MTIRGGTNNLAAPPFEFVDRAFLPQLRRAGYDVTAALTRPGFYPAGGGEIIVEIGVSTQMHPLDMLTRGVAIGRKGEAVVANLDVSIARREAETLCTLLNWPQDVVRPLTERRAKGPGNIVVATLAFEHVTEVCVAFGRVGVCAETIAEECATQAASYLLGDHPVGAPISPISCFCLWRSARAALLSPARRRHIC